MTPPPGRFDFTFSFAADGTEAKPRTATGVGHVVFIAPYSGAAEIVEPQLAFSRLNRFSWEKRFVLSRVRYGSSR